MTRTFTFILLLSFSLSMFSQDSVQVTMGASYANEVFYSFEDGTLKSSARTDWDIAFNAAKMSVSILANTGSGLELYTYPDTIGSWDVVDTTDMSWTSLYNSIVTWETGAFNTNTNTGNFDYGWGIYNMSNHFIVGDSIYIVKLADGTYKKLAIIEKDAPNNQWTFKYADLDGGNEKSETFDADDYSTSFVYYSLANGDFVDQEPESRWQLLFTKYFDYTYMNGYGYNMTGILVNSDVYVQEVAGIDTASDSYDLSLFNDTISQIGSDWKTFDLNTYTYNVSDSLVFFVQDSLDSENGYPVYKMIITAFGGSTDGTVTFTQEKVSSSTSIYEEEQAALSVYPNPASNVLNINNNFSGTIEVAIYNINGRKVLYSSSVDKSLDISVLSPGIYNLVISAEDSMFTSKFIKE